MKTFVILIAVFAKAFCSLADSLEKFSPNFSTNTEIVWQAATNVLPKSFWIYKRLPPHPAYFQRIKTLASAKKFIVTKITPYYSEGTFSETPTNDLPPEIIEPIAELEAVADFGSSNVTVRLVSPILLSEVTRLLKAK